MANYLIGVHKGHGGKDPGAVRGNIYEKDITLAVGNFFDGIMARHGVKTFDDRVIDRDNKIVDFVPLVNGVNPNIGIAFHVNAGGGKGAAKITVKSSGKEYSIKVKVK